MYIEFVLLLDWQKAERLLAFLGSVAVLFRDLRLLAQGPALGMSVLFHVV